MRRKLASMAPYSYIRYEEQRLLGLETARQELI